MADPVHPAPEPTSGESQEQGGIMGFLSNNAAPLIAGVVALIGFGMGGIGTIVGLLAAAAAAVFAFMPGAKDQATEVVNNGLQAVGLQKPKPQKELALKVEIDSPNSKQPIVEVDGRKYEVKMVTESDKQSRANVTKAEYRLAGSTDAFVELDLPKGENARVVGMIGEGGFTINQKQFESNIASTLKKKIEANGKAAKNEMGIEGFLPAGENTFKFMAGKDGAKSAYTVTVDQKAGSLIISDAATGKEITSVSDITNPAALLDGGALNRNVAIALKKHSADTSADKPTAAALEASKVVVPAAANAVTNITYDQPQSGVMSGKFKVDGVETTFEMKQDAAVKVQELTITRNGRPIKVAADGLALGRFEEKDGASKFVLDQEKLKPLLEKAIKQDDAEVAKFAAPLVKVSADAAAVEDKYIYNSKSGMYRVNITDKGFSITDHAGNVVKDGEGSDISGGKDAVLREALHKIKDLKISPEAAPKRGTEQLAYSVAPVPYTPSVGVDTPAATMQV